MAPTVEWERAAPGDTVIVPDSLIVFFIDRPELNRLRVNQRNDSVKIAQQDSALGDYAEAVDSLEGALTGCKQRARGLMIQRDWKDTVITAERDARKALEEAQQGSLFRGPSGFLMGTGAGLTAGVLACRGAN